MILNFFKRHFEKIALLIVPLTAFSGLFYYEVGNYLEKQEKEFQDSTLRMKFIIKDEMQKFFFGLEGVKGFISGSGLNYTPEQFRIYALSRNFFSNFSGSLGFGFIRVVPKEKLTAFLTEKRKRNSNFNIHPTADTDPLLIIESIEPIEKNSPALGLNIAFESKRADAAKKSADSGSPILTDIISLVQLRKKHKRFLYLMPVYSTGFTPFTIKERQKTLIGWAYTPILLEAVIAALKEKLPSDIHLDLFVGDDPTPLKVGSGFERSVFITNTLEESAIVGGLNWKMFFSKSPNKENTGLFLYFIAYLVGSGFIISWYRYSQSAYKAKDASYINQQKWTKAIVESSDHAIISTDSTGTILTFNPAAERMLGYCAEEIIGRHNTGILHLPEEVTQRSEQLTRELGIKVPATFDAFTVKAKHRNSDTNDWTYVRKNGSHLRARLTVTAIRDESDVIIGYLGLATDLTDELKSQQIIETQRAKMIEASKMSSPGEMAGGVAHEINTPLAVIITKSSTVKKHLSMDNIDKEVIIGNIQKIEQTAQHISRIIKGLRLFSRNSDSDQLTEVSLRSVISLTLDLCQEKIKFNGIKLTLDVPEYIRVLGRESELSQVIMNLIANSIDAITPLPLKWIKIECSTDNSRIKLTITDSGLGIAPSIANKMMQPFFTTKEVGKGTGLGLSISKGIIENFKGSLYYNSVSRNTQFVIELWDFEQYLNKKAG